MVIDKVWCKMTFSPASGTLCSLEINYMAHIYTVKLKVPCGTKQWFWGFSRQRKYLQLNMEPVMKVLCIKAFKTIVGPIILGLKIKKKCKNGHSCT